MSKTFKDLLVIALSTLLLTALIWLPHYLALPNFFGLNFSQGISTIYRNFDGLEYITIAKTFYNPQAIAGLPYSHSANYYAAHFPGFSILILLFAPFLGFLKSMLFISVIFTAFSAMAFYFLVRDFKLSTNPLFLSVIFLILPARWVIVHSVGSAEPIFSFFVICSLYFFMKYEKQQNYLNLIYASIFGLAAQITRPPGILLFIAALITSHNLSAFIFLPVTIIWAILMFSKRKQVKFIWVGSLSLILGLMLSAFYLLPMVSEKNLVHVDTTTSGYFGYTEHFKGFKKLFLERSWGWGASVREVPGGERDGISFQIGWVHLLGWCLALYTSVKLWKKNRWISLVIIFSSLVILGAIFMVNPRSESIWRSIDLLKYLQFPWRFLLLIIFFISFISGSFFLTFLKDKKYIWVSLFILVVVLNFFYFKPEKFIQTSDQDLLTGKNWDKQIKRSIFDYLPIYAKEPPAELATQRYEILTGDTKILDFKEGTNWISFKTETKTHSIIRLSQYYFPDWKIFVDGKEINVEYKNNSLGLMTIILGEGNHTVSARLYDTPVRSISNILTVTVASLMLFLFIIQFSRVRKWVLYYRKRIN